MDSPPDGEDSPFHLSRIDCSEDSVANYWRMHRKPATYSEEHTMAQPLEPFVRQQQRNNKIAPISSPRSSTHKHSSSQFLPTQSSPSAHPNTTVRPSPPASPFFNSDDMSGVSIPLKIWEKSPIRNPSICPRSADESPPASLDDVSRVERSALCFDGSLSRLKQKSRKQTKDSVKVKGKDKSDCIMDTTGTGNNTPPTSHLSQETPPGSSKSIPSTNNDSINTAPESSSSSYVNNTADSYDSTRPQHSGSTQQTTSNSNSSGSGNGDLEHSKKQRPTVPRIIIPDGTSINLSTPPTTPRQPPRQIHSRKMPVPIWPDRFIQLRDRMWASERMARFNRSKPTAPTPTGDEAQENRATAIGQGTRAVEPEVAPNTQGDPVFPHLSYSPVLGILGIPHYGDGHDVESETSSQRQIWWDDNDNDNSEEAFSGWCSKEWWRHVLCTRPGLTNTGKRLVTTTLGLVVILALALTALGKIRNQNRVSDVIPDNLEGKVYEAQVIIIEDIFGTMPKPLEWRQGEEKGTKVPIWDHPLSGCFQQRCETEIWKEFVAFMSPESFGIQLKQNWPSLCSSCIEISRNQFVYRTTVRVLGDLSQCAPTTSSPPKPSSLAPSLPSALLRTAVSKVQISSYNVRATPSSKPKSTPQHHGHGAHTPKRPIIPKSTPKPRTRAPNVSKTALSKRQEVAPSQGETFPSLIVDPATFNNLTEYDSVNAIQSMQQLRVQFRFVLCDD